jgi:hypothetical protein
LAKHEVTPPDARALYYPTCLASSFFKRYQIMKEKEEEIADTPQPTDLACEKSEKKVNQ